jgi:hypothetical protein
MSQPTSSRRAVAELAEALRVLHARLLQSVQVGFEKLHGRVHGPGALLQLALHDPLFTWLQPLSRQIVALDELAESEAPDLEQARASVSRLIDAPGDFRSHYLACLQADPAVVMAHAALSARLSAASCGLLG